MSFIVIGHYFCSHLFAISETKLLMVNKIDKWLVFLPAKLAREGTTDVLTN